MCIGVSNATVSGTVQECMREKVRKSKDMDWKFDSFKKCCFCWLYLSHVTQSKLMIDPPLLSARSARMTTHSKSCMLGVQAQHAEMKMQPCRTLETRWAVIVATTACVDSRISSHHRFRRYEASRWSSCWQKRHPRAWSGQACR